jgi:hypothetical protein
VPFLAMGFRYEKNSSRGTAFESTTFFAREPFLHDHERNRFMIMQKLLHDHEIHGKRYILNR